METLKVLELFGGIGACSNALKRLNIPFEIVDYVEIDKYAVKSYNAIYGTNFEPQDITNWNKDIEVNLIMHGSPCQDFSLAGKQAGGDEGSGTRSSLMYETLRIVEKLRPKYVIWENVKNILSNKHIHNFNAYLDKMEQLGYTNYYQVLNAKDYSIPQNRERVFTVSILNKITSAAMRGRNPNNPNDRTTGCPTEQRIEISNKEISNCITTVQKDNLVCEQIINFEFPPKQELKLKLKDMLEDEVDKKYFISKALNIRETKNYLQWDNSGKGYNSQQDRAYYLSGLAPTLSSCNTNGDKSKIVFSGNSENTFKIRKLTPKECWRLMGFDDEDFEKARQVNSDTQLYKQAGNSICVNVLVEIFRNLFNLD